jgi:AraC-like DNA-binding protein
MRGGETVHFAGRLYPMDRLTDDVTFRRLARARDFLAAGYNERIPLERAAREACLSPFHFQRMFARVFGETPHEFVTRLRMDTAKRLLASGEMPVTDVCLEVGYSSIGTFSARFAAQIGRAPSEYRRQARRFVAPVGGWRVYRVPSCYMSFWRIPQF